MMLLGVDDLGMFVLGAVGIVLVPGPNSIFCLTVAGKYGIKAGYCASGGILLGDLTLMTLSALGATSLFLAMPWLFGVIKLLGGCYLAYLGFNLLCTALQKWSSASIGSSSVSDFYQHIQQNSVTFSASSIFRRALLLSLSNPKGILFFLAFFVRFINPDYRYPVLSFLLLAVIMQMLSMLYLSILIFSGRALAVWFSCYRRIAAMGMACIGILFLCFAVQLWMATIQVGS